MSIPRWNVFPGSVEDCFPQDLLTFHAGGGRSGRNRRFEIPFETRPVGFAEVDVRVTSPDVRDILLESRVDEGDEDGEMVGVERASVEVVVNDRWDRPFDVTAEVSRSQGDIRGGGATGSRKSSRGVVIVE